jgi:hypothetical protein
MNTPFRTFEIIAADTGIEKGRKESGILGWNLYTPAYGETFLGHFRTLPAAVKEAARLGGEATENVRIIL